MLTFFLSLRAACYGGLFMSFWMWVQLGARRYDGWLGGPLPEWIAWVGVPLMLAGGGLAIACVGLFVSKGRGTAAPFDPPREFVVRGPYRFVRNPMYVGAIVFLGGFALWLRSPAMLGFLCIPALCGAAFVRLVEEPGLKLRFGRSYADYLQSVPRWLPRIPRRAQGVR